MRANWRKWAMIIAAPLILFLAVWPVAAKWREHVRTEKLIADLSSSNPNTSEILSLLSHGAQTDQTGNGGFAAIHAAVWSDPHTFRIVLEHTDNVNVRNIAGFTPLMLAAYNGSDEHVKLLLKQHANVNLACLIDNSTALDMAREGMTFPGQAQNPHFLKTILLLKQAGAK